MVHQAGFMVFSIEPKQIMTVLFHRARFMGLSNIPIELKDRKNLNGPPSRINELLVSFFINYYKA